MYLRRIQTPKTSKSPSSQPQNCEEVQKKEELKKEESSLTHVFLEMFDGSRVDGYDFCKWIGYDEGTVFVPSEDNPHIGIRDRSGSLYYPDGIQENDVISLHDGEYTRVRRVEKSMTVYKSDDYIRYCWWFISDEIDTDKKGWGDKGSSNKTALGFIGMFKNK